MTPPLLPSRRGRFSACCRGVVGSTPTDNRLRERREVPLPLPQEALMWAAFGRCVQAVRDGAPPVAQWPQRTLLTQEILCALQTSFDEGGKAVAL